MKLIVTKLSESKAFKKSRKIKPSETEVDIKIFFKIKFRLKVIAKNKGIKKDKSWVAFAAVKFSG